jgi:hypothetical protein
MSYLKSQRMDLENICTPIWTTAVILVISSLFNDAVSESFSSCPQTSLPYTMKFPFS